MEQPERCIANENFRWEEIQVVEDEAPASYSPRRSRYPFQHSILIRLISTVSTISEAVRKNGLKGWLVLSGGVVWIIALIASIIIIIYVVLLYFLT